MVGAVVKPPAAKPGAGAAPKGPGVNPNLAKGGGVASAKRMYGVVDAPAGAGAGPGGAAGPPKKGGSFFFHSGYSFNHGTGVNAQYADAVLCAFLMAAAYVCFMYFAVRASFRFFWYSFTMPSADGS